MGQSNYPLKIHEKILLCELHKGPEQQSKNKSLKNALKFLYSRKISYQPAPDISHQPAPAISHQPA